MLLLRFFPNLIADFSRPFLGFSFDSKSRILLNLYFYSCYSCDICYSVFLDNKGYLTLPFLFLELNLLFLLFLRYLQGRLTKFSCESFFGLKLR